MATIADAITFARAQAQTNSDGLTDTNGIVFANEALLDYRRKLITSGVDASGLQESYFTTTSGTGTYLYPTDMFWLKAIELSTDGTNYKLVKQADVSNITGDQSFTDLRDNASTDEPQFDDRGDWYELFPTPDGAWTVRIFYFLEPTEFSATSDTISYPESLDYRILGLKIASSYLDSVERFDLAAKLDEKYEKRVAELIATLSRGVQQPLQATPIQITGFEF